MNIKKLLYVQGMPIPMRYLAIALSAGMLSACVATTPADEASSSTAAAASSSVAVVVSSSAVAASSIAPVPFSSSVRSSSSVAPVLSSSSKAAVSSSSVPASSSSVAAVACATLVEAGKETFTFQSCEACHGPLNESTGTTPGRNGNPAINVNSFKKFNESSRPLSKYLADGLEDNTTQGAPMMNFRSGCKGDAECEQKAYEVAVYLKNKSNTPLCKDSVASSVAPMSSAAPSSSSVASSSSAAAVAAGQLVVAINVGGAKTQLNNVEYGDDRFYTGGTANTTQAAIAGVTEDTLFQSERYGAQKYEVPVTSGTYNVTFHFNENYQTAAGARSFNVSVEGQNRLASLDIYSLVGGNTAYSVNVDSIPVSDGNLSISLDAVIFNPTLSGFAIYSTDGGKFVAPPEPVEPLPGEKVPSAGCGKAPGQLGSANSPLNIGPSTNKYYVTLPNNYNNSKPYNVVFVHHPSGSTTGITWGANGANFPAEAKANSIFVYPQTRNGSSGWLANDMDMFEPLYNKITGDFCVNKAGVFATGYSSGGDYSGMIGCEHGDKITAIAPTNTKTVGAYPLTVPTRRACKGNVKAIIFHNPKDTLVGGTNGKAMADFYRSLNNCGTATVPYPGYNTEGQKCVTYQGCKAGAEVSYCEHNASYGSPRTEHGYPSFTGPLFWDVIKSY